MTEQITIELDEAIYDFLPVVRKILKRELPSIFVGRGTPFDEIDRPDARMRRWGIPSTICNSVITENVYEVFNAGSPYDGVVEALTSLHEDESCDVRLYSRAWKNGNTTASKRSQSAKRNWLTKQGFETIPVSFSPTRPPTDSSTQLTSHQAVLALAATRQPMNPPSEDCKTSGKVLALQS